jgi:hypothetical protein
MKNIITYLVTKHGVCIGIIRLLQIVITINYSAIANSQSLQFTMARTKYSQSVVSSPFVAW